VPVSANRNVRVVKVPRGAKFVRFFTRRPGIILLSTLAVLAVAFITTFTFFYIHYSRIIDAKLRGGPFTNTSKIYAAPETIGVGDAATPSDIVAQLRRSGYTEARSNPNGWFNTTTDTVQVFPGPESFFEQEAGVIKFAAGKIVRITSLRDNTDRPEYELEPQLLTNLYDRNREKRRLIKYDEIPPVLVHAIISIEDKRFFQHVGFDPLGIVRSVWVDVKEGRKLSGTDVRGRNAQGASTLSQQLARGMFLTPDRSLRRKLEELLITVELEQKLTKKEIFEFYCNQMDLGRRGSFDIRGFGEASQVYFGKSVRNLNVAESATLAGMLQAPSRLNPYRHPDRVKERRNVVLSLMRQNGYVDDREYAIAAESPVKVSSNSTESSDAPYFVDLLNDELQTDFQDYDFQTQAYRLYTSLDMQLQRAANEAVRIGMASVDEQLKKQKRFKGVTFPDPQVALIALDPHTGEIKALVGGRNYGASQLDHVMAKRQPGSIFKPWVYAAAMNTAINGGQRTLTPATTVVDEPTTFWFDGKPYEPSNFEHEFYGNVTLRRALAKSMNIATIKVAEMVGYGAVVNLAHKAGINGDVHATPAVALGAYDATPLEMAGSYTVFANKGEHVSPTFLSEIKDKSGKIIFQSKAATKQVLDPRVNYLMVSMLQEVMRSGTAAGVRSRGFTVPAAGKTGTSHDGWFAGFTSGLLCVVWVGFDDNRELNLEGAHSALPIWTEFMKRAIQLRSYRDAKPFPAPQGVVTLDIDPESGMPATPSCPQHYSEVFIAGTEPVGTCPLHGGTGNGDNVSGWDTPAGKQPPHPPSPDASLNPAGRLPESVAGEPQTANNPPEKKKGFFHKLIGVVK
jgi:penicillin-binding protein 1B